jgi:hypothetical protein
MVCLTVALANSLSVSISLDGDLKDEDIKEPQYIGTG